MKRSLLAPLFVSFSLLFTSAVQAQDDQIVIAGEEPEIVISGDAQQFVDYKGEMRQFIQRIARYARQLNRNFLILVKDANGLLHQTIDIDEQVEAPSSVYIRALDGIIQPNLAFGADAFGEPSDPKLQEQILSDLKAVKNMGLSVFTLDNVSKPADVDKAFRLANRNGFVPYAAPAAGFMNNRIANWPRRPFNENSHTIRDIKQVQNFVFLNDSSRFGSRDQFAMEIHNTNFDMVVTDVFHHRFQPLTKQNIRTMQFKKLGARRLVLAKMNIGFANVGRYYWQDSWRQGNPPWVLDLAPLSSDEHLVQYWNPAWQQLMFGNRQSYLYGIIDQGFDGVVLEGAYVHELFENPE